MNEQKINVCRALASVFTVDDEITDEEVAFVGRTALDLGLEEAELNLVQQALGTHLDYREVLGTITDPLLRRFLVRRVVAATLIDEHISDKEKEAVSTMAEVFGWDADVLHNYVEHMQAFIEMEKKGEEILAKLG